MKYRVFILIATIFFLLILVSCEWGLEITKVELGRFPDNIVYYMNEEAPLDLKGCTMIVHTRGAGIFEDPLDKSPAKLDYDIDFSKPGVYEVKIMWGENLVGRFPVQVIERG